MSKKTVKECAPPRGDVGLGCPVGRFQHNVRSQRALGPRGLWEHKFLTEWLSGAFVPLTCHVWPQRDQFGVSNPWDYKKTLEKTEVGFTWSCQRCFSPHLCVGFVFLILHPVRLPVLLPSSRRQPYTLTTCSHITCSHTTYSLTHNLHTHTACSHTTCSHTTCTHTAYSHTTCTHTAYSHTTCSHTACSHTTCSHTTCSHRTCTHTTCSYTTYSHTTCSHTTCSHTTCTHTQLTHTQLAHTHNLLTHNLLTHNLHTHSLLTHNLLTHSLLTHNLLTHNLLTHNLFLAGVALGDMHLRFTWLTHNLHIQNLLTHNLITHKRTHIQLAHTQLTHTQLTHTQLAHIQLLTQAWHLATWIVTLHGRRGTYGTRLALVARSVPTCPGGRRGFLRGRRGSWRHPSSFHVAGVVLGDIHLRFTWQAWYSTYSHTTCSHTTYSHTTYSRTTCTHTITHAGVALGDMDRHFAWQAWHVWHWAGSGGALGSHVPTWSPRLFAWQAWHLETSIFVSRGRRGTWWHPPSFHVAGVVLDLLTHNLFIHNLLTHTTYSRTTCTHTTYSRRRGTWRHGSSLCVAGVARMALGWLWWRARFPRAPLVAAAFCVAGVALGDIHLRFTWQAWYLVTSTFVSRGRRGTRLTHTQLVHTQLTHTQLTHAQLAHIQLLTQAWHLATWIVTWRGRRGTYGTGLALVARSVPTCPGGRRGFLRGRRGTWRHPSSFHVAGVVLGDIHLRFTWQAWYSTYSHTTCSYTTYSHATYSRTTCTHTITHAGVALGDMDRHFAWQAWHVWHWAGSGGALGSHVPTWSPRLFAWQAWHLETSIFVSRGRRGTWWHPPSFHVAGVVLDLLTHNLFTHNLLTHNLLTHNLHTYNLLPQAWHLATVVLGHTTCQEFHVATLRGRRVALCDIHIRVALWDIHLGFTRQAWYLDTSTSILRGRRGAYGTGLHSHVTHSHVTNSDSNDTWSHQQS